MDDYNLNSLTESRNEWTARLVTILYPFVIEGFKSIYNDSYKLCIENDEEEKYLMTYQNLLSQIPKWNTELIEKEVERIKNNSKCGYIEDLITCVHIIQLKALTCVRVGQHQKKVDLARKLYSNIYLFQKGISPLEIQKHNREIEIIVKECILCAIRDTIPLEEILRNYLDEVIEENVEVEEEIIPIEEPKETLEKQDMVEDTKQEDSKQENSSNIIIEEVMNEDDPVKLKTDDNIKIDDNNYGIMLDVNDLVSNKEEDVKTEIAPVENENVLNPIQNDLENNNVSFSSDINMDMDNDDDRINILDTPIVLDDVENLDDPVLDNIEVLG